MYRRLQRLARLAVPLGLIALAATSTAQAGRPATSATKLPYALPAQGTPPPFSIFGLDHGTFDRNPIDYNPKEFVYEHKLGGRWTHFNGNAIHWKNGNPDWSSLDFGIKLARKHGLAVLLSLGGEPHACSIHPTPNPIYNCPPTTSSDLKAYQSFVREEVLRYRNVVSYYESWIEPNHTGKWPPYPNPAQYAALLKDQYSVFQSVNKEYGLHLKLLFAGPNGFSTGPGSSGGMAVLPWTDQVLTALRGQRPFDAVGLHPFRLPPVSPGTKEYDDVKGIPARPGTQGPFSNCSWANPATKITCLMNWRQEIEAYEQDFTIHGYGKPDLWLTEFGWPGVSKVPPHPQPSAAYYPRLKAQKSDLEAAYKIILSLPFVKAASWFNERDYVPGVQTTDPPFYAHMGLLTYSFGYKPAGNAFEALSRKYPSR
ncbi:MAG TPA: hypothetical protein VE983_05275 [Solirubrobacteraceae bacterium]|nr:hypothetical protein [Solirubrobacteraceae bacterium]